MGAFAQLTKTAAAEARHKHSEWSDDEKMDALVSSGLANVVPFGGPVLSGLTAPGGRYIQGPLREGGRGLLEGLGGVAAGGVAGAGLAHLLGLPNKAENPKGLILAALGAGAGGLAGGIHGQYASRRNQRAETGDYHPFGHNRGKNKGQDKDKKDKGE